MVRFAPKTVTLIGIGVLCFSALLAYASQGLSGSNSRPTATLVWIAFGSGFVLTGGGLITETIRLDTKRRTILAISLMAFGIILFVLALAIAHVGPILLVFAFPMLVFGLIVAIMALFFPCRRPEPRRQ